MSKVGKERWHTTRRENPKDYEQVRTPDVWGRIVSAIINYQNKRNGASPSDHQIAADTLMSIGQVQYHLREMAKAQVITVLGDYPRVIAVHQVAKPTKEIEPPKEEVMPTRASPRFYNPAPFFVRAKMAAEAIELHWREKGEAPTIAWLQDTIYEGGRYAATATASGATRLVQKMVERGFLTHTKHRQADLKLTDKGRAALLGAQRLAPAVRAAFNLPAEEPVIGNQRNARKPFINRAHDVAKAIVDLTDRTGRPASVRELSKAVYGPASHTGGMSRMLRLMANEGWISHKSRHHNDVMLTGAGRAALFNEIPEPVATDMPVSAVRDQFTGIMEELRAPRYLPPVRPPRATIPRVSPRWEEQRFAPEPTGTIKATVRADEYFAGQPESQQPRTIPWSDGDKTYSITGLSDMDLVLELTRRGFKVSR